MRKCHFRQRYKCVGTIVYLLRESIGSSDNKDERAGQFNALASYKLREITRGELLAALVEQHHKVARRYFGQKTLAFKFFLFFASGRTSGLHIGKAYVGEGPIKWYLLAIL